MAAFFWISWFVLVVVNSVLFIKGLLRGKKQHKAAGIAWTRVEELLFYWLSTAQLLVMFCLSLYGSTFSTGAVGGFTAQKLLMAVITTALIPPNLAAITLLIVAERAAEKSKMPHPPSRLSSPQE